MRLTTSIKSVKSPQTDQTPSPVDQERSEKLGGDLHDWCCHTPNRDYVSADGDLAVGL